MNNLLMIPVMLVIGTLGGFSQKVIQADTSAKLLNHGSGKKTEAVRSSTGSAVRGVRSSTPVEQLSSSGYKYDRHIGADEILLQVPGLFVQSHFGEQDALFSARGYGIRLNHSISGIRILLDGIPETEPDGQTSMDAIDVGSIRRVEFLAGDALSSCSNAPGGVISFLTDMDFDRSSVRQFNLAGSSGLYKNGFRAAVKTGKSRMLTNYSYLNFDGFRQHNKSYRHILNMLMETDISAHSNLTILGYFADGEIRYPGALTKEEFASDPYQANPSAVTNDEKRFSTNARLGIRYNAAFGRKLNNEAEVTAWSTIRFSEEAATGYRVINRYVAGLTGKYIHRSLIGNRHNEFSAGFDLSAQPTRNELYDNLKGEKGNFIIQVLRENITSKGIYISDNFEILKEKMFLLLAGRYDNTMLSQTQQTLPSLAGHATFSDWSPKISLNYNLAPMLVLFASCGLSSDPPAMAELGSRDPDYLLNQDIRPRKSKNGQLGIKGTQLRSHGNFFRNISYEATLFAIGIENEVIPYDLQGVVYARNAAKTSRRGVELGARIEIYRNLRLGLCYTWSDFTYTSYQTRLAEMTPAGTFTENYRDFSGMSAPGIPRNNMYISLEWSHPAGRHLGIFVKSTYQGISSLWADDGNTERISAYNLLDGVLGLNLKFGKFSVMASGGAKNILDEVYAGFLNTNSADKRYYEAGAPRNYFMSVNLGYNF
ncbi:MAG: TonB-dependent receptor [Bacteroidota bacterium]